MRPHQLAALVFFLVLILALLAMLGDSPDGVDGVQPDTEQLDGTY